MLHIRDEIIEYTEELFKTFKYITEVNAIGHVIAQSGMWAMGAVQIVIDNYEVFSVNDQESTFKLYMSNYDNISSISDYRAINECSLVKYTRDSQEINFCSSLYSVQDAYEHFEEICFQHSTLNHKCALDAFEMVMYATNSGLDQSFLLTTPMDLKVLVEFNRNFDEMITDTYERYGRYRE